MTKRFNFSLQKLLEIRDRRENSQSHEFKCTHNDMVNEKTKLTDIQDRKDIAIAEGSDDDGAGRVSLNQIRVSSSYVDQLSVEINEQEKIVEGSELKMEKARDDLIEASKEKMIIEQLRDRHISEYTKKNNKDERKQESETAQRISRKGSKT